MPQRFDVLSRSMDANIVSQWLALQAACDLVLWGPGLDGFVPGMPIDEVAEYVDADVVLLPDLHHALPWLWTELWAGIERSRRPVVWHLVDHGSTVAERRAVFERIRPAAVLSSCAAHALHDYDDLRERFDTQVLVVPWGYDAVQFHPPAPGAARDIDLLVAGAEVPEEVYRVRNRVKRAARSLAGEYRVVDLGHPGYWETTGLVLGRGQAQYADLLRRTRLATTGTAFGSALTRKYWESAGCGAIGVGDLPLGEPDRERFLDGTLCVDDAWDEDRIAQEMRDLLSDPDRCALMSRAASGALGGCDHRERAHDYVAALATVALPPTRERRPRPFPAAAPARKVCAAAEPAAVPVVRADWIDVWAGGPSGASRTRRTAEALAGEEDVVVLALDPDATLDVDALILVTACRCSGSVVVRPRDDTHDGDALKADWSAVAAPRAALRQALSRRRGRAGLEAAIVDLGRDIGWQLLPGGAYTDPATALLRLSLRPDRAGIEVALARALEQQHADTAIELAGLRAVAGWGPPPPRSPDFGVAAPAQDPECELLDGAAFACFDPRDPAHVAAIAAHARLGPGAPPLHVGVPLSAGVAVGDALSRLAEALAAEGVDVDAGADLVMLERPLFEAEIAWLQSRLGPPARGGDARSHAAAV